MWHYFMKKQRADMLTFSTESLPLHLPSFIQFDSIQFDIASIIEISLFGYAIHFSNDAHCWCMPHVKHI